jgi:ribonucleoside-diphosphate reductase alpha chain
MDIYWLNKDSRAFLSHDYLLPGVTPEQRMRTIAEHAERILAKPGFADRFESYLHKGWYSLASPVWSNFGAGRGLPISCNGSYVADSLHTILDKVSEVGMMSKYGAGTSVYLGALRARGEAISVGGKSMGPVHFAQLFETVTNVVSQSSVRRGSCAAYLPVEHPDIMEFLDLRSEGHPIHDLSFGVCIGDDWMKAMMDGDKEKRKVWGKIIKTRFATGYPYLFFTDTANRAAPQVYKDKGLRIHASNLCCVVGSERVVTSRGFLTAKELYEAGGGLTVFDGKAPVQASEMRLIERDTDVYRVVLENGMTHTITPCHKVRVFDCHADGFSKQTTRNVECRDLKVGDKVAVQLNKGLFGDLDMQDEAFLLGQYQADGTQYGDGEKHQIHLCLWEPDFDLVDEVQQRFDRVCDKYDTQHSSRNSRVYDKPTFHENVVCNGIVRKKSLVSRALFKALRFEKGHVPDWVWKANEATQWQYVRGLFYADGSVNVSGTRTDGGAPLYLALANINKRFLEELQILLRNLGLSFGLYLMHKARKTLLPDGKGGQRYYDAKDCWRLVCSSKNDALVFERHTGFLTRKGVTLDKAAYRDNGKKGYRITAIEPLGKQDVYCCEVYTDDHLWVVNGVITHNSEIALHSSPDESFVCDLSSLNILHYDDWKDTDAVETLTWFLDANMSDYIDKVATIPHMKAAHTFAANQRALGVGVLGWHSYLQSKMIPFESMEAKLLNTQIHRLIRDKTLAASKAMAVELGEPPLLKGYGVRNVTTMAIAPTTSSSFILGQVSPSIEPLNSNLFVKALAKGKYTYKNPYLIKVLAAHDHDDKKTWDSILAKGGSVQHLTFLTDNERDVFKTFAEISPKEVVIQAAARQRYIDQGQSLNLMIPSDATPKQVSELLIFAWESGLKSIYYQRMSNAVQEMGRNLMDCKSCQA